LFERAKPTTPRSDEAGRLLRYTKFGTIGVRRKFSWRGFQSAKIFLCTEIESMIRKNIKQAAIQYVNVVKQL